MSFLYTDWRGNLNELHISDLSRDHGLNIQPFKFYFGSQRCMSGFSLLGHTELHAEEILPLFLSQKVIESSVKACVCLNLTSFRCSTSQIFTHRAQHPRALKLGGQTRK